MGTRDCRHNIKPIHKFSGSTIRRQTCRVVLLFTFCDCNDNYVEYFRFFMRYLETLIGFSRLLLGVRFRGPMNAREQRIWPHWRMAMLERAQDALKGVLGPSTWHGTVGPNCDYWEFHPRGHMEANPGTLSPKIQRSIDEWAKYPKRAL